MRNPAIAEVRKTTVSFPVNFIVGLSKLLDQLGPGRRDIIRPVLLFQRLQ
jgi:hypothetical protein